jgi:hypothetical protein
MVGFGGAVSTVVNVVLQPAPSVTTHEYVPAVKFVTDGVPSPAGFPGNQL